MSRNKGLSMGKVKGRQGREHGKGRRKDRVTSTAGTDTCGGPGVQAWHEQGVGMCKGVTMGVWREHERIAAWEAAQAWNKANIYAAIEGAENPTTLRLTKFLRMQ